MCVQMTDLARWAGPAAAVRDPRHRALLSEGLQAGPLPPAAPTDSAPWVSGHLHSPGAKHLLLRSVSGMALEGRSCPLGSTVLIREDGSPATGHTVWAEVIPWELDLGTSMECCHSGHELQTVLSLQPRDLVPSASAHETGRRCRAGSPQSHPSTSLLPRPGGRLCLCPMPQAPPEGTRGLTKGAEAPGQTTKGPGQPCPRCGVGLRRPRTETAQEGLSAARSCGSPRAWACHRPPASPVAQAVSSPAQRPALTCRHAATHGALPGPRLCL